mgnify:FL=1
MEKNIAMQITQDLNPEEARLRKGDIIIGREDRLNTIITKNQSFLEKNYKLRAMTIDDVEKSKDVKYHYFTYGDIHRFEFETVNKDVALKHLLNKKQIAITHHDTRILKHLIDEENQLSFLNNISKYKCKCFLNEKWVNLRDEFELLQINYYNSLKTDTERQVYAEAIGQQYALNLLLSPIFVLTDTYGLDFINTLFTDIEFYFDDTASENDDDQYVTSLKIKELWLPAEDFNLDDDTETKTVNGIEFIQIDDAVEQYSFTNNRIRYDSHWYSDFLIKL